MALLCLVLVVGLDVWKPYSGEVVYSVSIDDSAEKPIPRSILPKLLDIIIRKLKMLSTYTLVRLQGL